MANGVPNINTNIHEEGKLGIGQGVQVHKVPVYHVAEVSSRGLITTSGRMGTTTLDETSDMIIADFGGRTIDWVITLNGIVKRVVHPDDTIGDPVAPG